MSDILALIDNAIEDWQVSGDAMRWTPELPVAAKIRAATSGGWHFLGNGSSFSYSPSRHYHELGQILADQITESIRALGSACLEVSFPLSDFGREFFAPAPGSAARERALEARRNRHTGPKPPRMDGRR